MGESTSEKRQKYHLTHSIKINIERTTKKKEEVHLSLILVKIKRFSGTICDRKGNLPPGKVKGNQRTKEAFPGEELPVHWEKQRCSKKDSSH